MEQSKFDQMLALVAQAYDTTPEIIYHKIALAIAEGQQNQDPQVQSLWATIPRTGPFLTLEDFVEYLAQTLPRPFDP